MRTILTFIFSILLLPCFGQNMVINGSFEDHSLNSCVPIFFTDSFCVDYVNTGFLSPNCIGGISTFGFNGLNYTSTGYFTYLFDGCNLYEDTTLTTFYSFGESPPNGEFYIAISSDSSSLGGLQNGMSLMLNSIINPGAWYKLSYYLKEVPTLDAPYTYHENNTNLSFSLGNDSLEFGTQFLHTSIAPDSIWTKQTVIFQANDNYKFLTLKANLLDSGLNVIALDHIVLTTDTATSVQEYVREPKLVRIVDMLGRETQSKKNTPLFYLFDDGTVEKRLIIE